MFISPYHVPPDRVKSGNPDCALPAVTVFLWDCMRKNPSNPLPGLLLAGLLSLPAHAAPVLKDIAYDDETPAQKLDVYRADSENPVPAVIHIHGGGWSGGSKNHVPGFLADAVKAGWLTVVSVEYRFIPGATHPAQTDDCTRAVQFVRSKAAEWNIDPARIGVTGGSAGAHLSLWVALHDDAADPKSADPVERQSSRVQCAVGFAGPTNWALLGKMLHLHPGYRAIIGYRALTPFGMMEKSKMDSVSPITYASADDPPVLIIHGDADPIVPLDHGKTLHQALEKAGAKPELHIVKGGNHDVSGANAKTGALATAFFKEHLAAD